MQIESTDDFFVNFSLHVKFKEKRKYLIPQTKHKKRDIAYYPLF